MSVLLVGPYPPPYGGISVHVSQLSAEFERRGVRCRVLNINRHAPQSPHYLSVRSRLHLLLILLQHAWNGWSVHVHTNGHNVRSWMMITVCGLAGWFAPARHLTLHSGMAVNYISDSAALRRRLVCRTCRLFDRITCVNGQIRDAVLKLGIAENSLKVSPAYVPGAPMIQPVPASIEAWIAQHFPVLSTALFFRPEYGFDVLLGALRELRRGHPEIGCIVMGDSANRQAAQLLVDKADLTENVLIAGDVEHGLCLHLISISHAFIRSTLVDGDSISVREALSCGVPTVASDAAIRPEGAVLFRTGEPDELAACIERVLQ